MNESAKINFNNDLKEILLSLADGKTLPQIIRFILGKALNYGNIGAAIALTLDENNIKEIFCENKKGNGRLTKKIESEIKKELVYILKWIEANKKTLIDNNDKDNIAFGLSNSIKNDFVLILPCYFNAKLLAVLILGQNDTAFTEAEVAIFEQFAPLLSLSISSITTRELNAVLEEGLLQSQKLETIGKLASGMAHDFSNLLSSIFGSINILKKKVAPNDEVYRLLDNIESCSIRARDLTKGLLSYGKPVAKRKEKVSINNLLDDISRVINQTFPKEITYISKIKPELYNVLGNGTEIYQVLLNLCVNAKEAIEGKGELTLSAENISVTKENNYLFPFLNAGEYVYLSVKDNGSGIPEENLQKIFDPYFSTKKKESGSGSGLGLYVTYNIIRALEGNINVESKPGKGTKFNVYLPSCNPLVKTVSEKSEKIIMLADDEIMLRDLLAELLASSGYSIITVSSGVEALKVLTEEIKIDLLIIDYNMPEMDGIECIKKIKELKLTFPIILSSGSSLESKKGDFENSGVNKLLYKPYEFEEMLSAIQELLV